MYVTQAHLVVIIVSIALVLSFPGVGGILPAVAICTNWRRIHACSQSLYDRTYSVLCTQRLTLSHSRAVEAE